MPAVHYHMGGVATDLNGRASLHGLWVAGEAAATGLHGANRLASNSLMEAIVMGARAAEDMAAFVAKGQPAPRINLAELPKLPAADMENERQQLREIMTDLVGVIRNEQGMKDAIREISVIGANAEGRDTKTADMALVARMIASCALARTESRGGHCRADYPMPVKALQKRTFTTLKEVEGITAAALLSRKATRETAA